MKKNNIFKVLTIAILISIVLSYFIPGTTMSYGSVEKGTIIPVPFADVFTNGITSLSAFLTTFIYVLIIGAFYAILKKTNKYDALVNDVAVKFNKNKGAFIVLTVFVLGLVTIFTGEIYAMLIFVPFLISVIKKLGYSNETSIVSTVGAILIGNAGSLYTYYANQMLSLTVSDNVLSKILVSLIGLVSLVAFVLVFGKKPNSTKDLKKSNERKMLPLHIIMWTMLVLLVLGFVNWAGYFNFTGFDTFLETLKSGKIAKVSVFDMFVGKTVVAFGNWQTFNAAVLFTFVSVLIALIYKVRINDFFEGFAEGLKKAFPYAVIVVLANIVLVNVYSSGVFYTMVIGLTKKTVSLFTSTISSVLAAFFFPDYSYATQFTLTGIMTTSAEKYESLFAITFQAVYSLFLLISPTSILLLFGLKYNGVRYKDWIKYIYKYFIVLLVTLLVVITISVNGFSFASIVALVLLVIAVGIIVYLRIANATKVVDVNSAKVEKKEEVKKTPTKKTTNKKAPVKKTSSNKKTTTKKTNKK